MTLAKKGSRKIDVDGLEYRWRVRENFLDRQKGLETTLTAVIELFDNPKNTLLVSFTWVVWFDNIDMAERPVLPRHIEQIIKQALNEGWRPFEEGNFRIEHQLLDD